MQFIDSVTFILVLSSLVSSYFPSDLFSEGFQTQFVSKFLFFAMCAAWLTHSIYILSAIMTFI